MSLREKSWPTIHHHNKGAMECQNLMRMLAANITQMQRKRISGTLALGVTQRFQHFHSRTNWEGAVSQVRHLSLNQMSLLSDLCLSHFIVVYISSLNRMIVNDDKLTDGLLGFYIMATSKVKSGQVSTCDSVHS